MGIRAESRRLVQAGGMRKQKVAPKPKGRTSDVCPVKKRTR